VSRALMGSPSVLPETREKVLAAAREQHYVRDRTAVRLKTGKTHVLAFMMDKNDSSQPGFKDLLLGLSQAMAGSDYHLIVLPEEESDSDPMPTVRYVVERGLADGLFLTRTLAQDARVRYLQERGFAFVTHGRTDLPEAHGQVDFANEQFVSMAVTALAQRSRQRLGLLLPMAGSMFHTHLRQGFEDACQQHSVQGQCIEAISLDDSPESIYQWACRHAHDFDGLIITREAPVLPLISAVTDAGLKVGTQMDLVIKYSSPLPLYIRQPFMACFEDLRLTGLTMGQQLLAQARNTAKPPAQTLFTPPHLQWFHPVHG
jgi:LacI family transcriptional regulator